MAGSPAAASSAVTRASGDPTTSGIAPRVVGGGVVTEVVLAPAAPGPDADIADA